MTEENKEGKTENPPPQKSTEGANPPPIPPEGEVKKVESAVPATAAAAPQSTAKEEKKEPVKKEKPSNCAGCNKSIKKKRWYYRNGKFYCTQRCWKASSKKKEAPAEAEENQKK